jgi:hypothetical protein
MRKLLLPALVILSTSVSAFADFEGVVEMKLSITDKAGSTVGGGSMNLAISKAGSRMEMNMQAPMAMKLVRLTKTDSPDKVYQIDDAGRTYSEADVSKNAETTKLNEDKEPWTVKKLGEEKILGYKTQHVMVTHQQETRELWTSKDLIDYSTYSRLQASRGRMGGEEGMLKALKDAGADGMPLKAVVSLAEMKTTAEIVKVDKKSLPPATFEIPAVYTKTTGDYRGFSSSDPRLRNARKQMDEALKNMTPEQREMFEKAMKQRQGGNPNP